jgi:hypothetical protein
MSVERTLGEHTQDLHLVVSETWCPRWSCGDILSGILVRFHFSTTTDDVCLHCDGIADNPLPFRDWRIFPPHGGCRK